MNLGRQDIKCLKCFIKLANIWNVVPTIEEMSLVHELYKQTNTGKTDSFSTRSLPPKSQWMEELKVSFEHVNMYIDYDPRGEKKLSFQKKKKFIFILGDRNRYTHTCIYITVLATFRS